MEEHARRPPWWLWPNLLSLDAPLVAVAWLWMMKQTWRVQYLPQPMYWILAGAIWCIYTADRLADTRIRPQEDWAARHHFHHRYRKIIPKALVTMTLLTCVVAFFVFRVGLIQYLVPGLACCFCYFWVTIFLSRRFRVSLTKNLIAGLTFAYGTALGAHFFLSSEGNSLGDLLASPVMLCFAALCVSNMSAIDLWENERRGAAKHKEPLLSDLALTPPLALIGGYALFEVLKAREIQRAYFSENPSLYFRDEYFAAVLISAAALLALNRCRHRLPPEALRVLADVALLVPFPLFLP